VQKFRSGLEIVEAVQVTNSTFDILHPNPEHIPGLIYDPLRRVVLLETWHGTETAALGDWIVRGAKGQLYLCKADVFEARYKPLSAKVLPFETHRPRRS
jgi:hypothetical protein